MVIARSSEELEKLSETEMWEPMGLVWSGPEGFKSLPEGFFTTDSAVIVDIGADIRGAVMDGHIIFGTESDNRVLPVVALQFKKREHLHALQSLIEEAECSVSEE